MLLWAEQRLRELKQDNESFVRRRPYALWSPDDAGGRRVAPWGAKLPITVGQSDRVFELRLSVAEFVTPIENLAPKVGDIIHNLRVSLDYLAFGIAARQNPEFVNDEKRARLVQFPICAKTDDWPSLARKLRIDEWASTDAIKWIKAAQPFRRPLLANLDPLLLLHELDNPHKHRNLIAAAPNVTAVDFAAEDPGNRFEVISLGLEGPFRDGAVVARGKFTRTDPATFRPSAKPAARVMMHVAFDIAFDDSGPAARLSVFGLLDEMLQFIRDGVFPALDRFATP
jgi:hypothetical protein